LQGKKNNGFSVLYHNMKYGLESTKEFEEFLRERYVSTCQAKWPFYVLELITIVGHSACEELVSQSVVGCWRYSWIVAKLLTEKAGFENENLENNGFGV